MWIYGTLTNFLLDTVIKTRCTTRELWLSLENLFCDNKETRSLLFDNELYTITIGDLSLSDYCQKLKTLPDLFANVDSQVPERNLVMHMLNDLMNKFDLILTMIKHQSPLPGFTEGKSMPISEETRLKMQIKLSPDYTPYASSLDVLFAASKHQNRQQFNNGYNKNNDKNGRGNDNYKHRGHGGS